jgi:hypothetical protein
MPPWLSGELCLAVGAGLAASDWVDDHGQHRAEHAIGERSASDGAGNLAGHDRGRLADAVTVPTATTE